MEGTLFLIDGKKYSLSGTRWYDEQGNEIQDKSARANLFSKANWKSLINASNSSNSTSFQINGKRVDRNGSIRLEASDIDTYSKKEIDDIINRIKEDIQNNFKLDNDYVKYKSEQPSIGSKQSNPLYIKLSDLREGDIIKTGSKIMFRANGSSMEELGNAEVCFNDGSFISYNREGDYEIFSKGIGDMDNYVFGNGLWLSRELLVKKDIRVTSSNLKCMKNGWTFDSAIIKKP